MFHTTTWFLFLQTVLPTLFKDFTDIALLMVFGRLIVQIKQLFIALTMWITFQSIQKVFLKDLEERIKEVNIKMMDILDLFFNHCLRPLKTHQIFHNTKLNCFKKDGLKRWKKRKGIQGMKLIPPSLLKWMCTKRRKTFLLK